MAPRARARVLALLLVVVSCATVIASAFGPWASWKVTGAGPGVFTSDWYLTSVEVEMSDRWSESASYDDSRDLARVGSVLAWTLGLLLGAAAALALAAGGYGAALFLPQARRYQLASTVLLALGALAAVAACLVAFFGLPPAFDGMGIGTATEGPRESFWGSLTEGGNTLEWGAGWAWYVAAAAASAGLAAAGVGSWANSLVGRGAKPRRP